MRHNPLPTQVMTSFRGDEDVMQIGNRRPAHARAVVWSVDGTGR